MPSVTVASDLILHNARVVTLDARRPRAGLVAVQGDRIAWVGDEADLSRLARPGVRVVDCQGYTLVPGLMDAHCHVLAYAASLLAVDCSPAAVGSIADIREAIRRRARVTPPGQWLRAAGYDESALAEGRHPTRLDLDEATRDHPVRLAHRSGHACVLNSLALARVGISASTPEPEGGVIDRDWATGEPTGLLLEMDACLEERIPSLSESELLEAIAQADRRLVALGVTSVQDATPSNDLRRWQLFQRLKAEGRLRPRVTLMPGSAHLEEFTGAGLKHGSGDHHLALGHVKLMLTLTSGALHPAPEELRAIVRRAHRAGFPVAIHAVEAEAVEAAADALLRAGRPPIVPLSKGDRQGVSLPARGDRQGGVLRRKGPRVRDRVEHCSECPPAVLAKLKRAGTTVVTQPAFLYYSGQRYLAQVPREMQPWLYRIRSFAEAGLRPAASSDAPVAAPNPLVGIYAAVTRRARTGEVLGAEERVAPLEALAMYTLNSARAAFQVLDRGSISPGKLADLVLLDRDITGPGHEELLQARVVMTLTGGEVAYEA